MAAAEECSNPAVKGFSRPANPTPLDSWEGMEQACNGRRVRGLTKDLICEARWRSSLWVPGLPGSDCAGRAARIVQ